MSGHRTARVLVYGHRWLGIVLGPLFIVWFASGIVMMYARMPELEARERLARLPPINPSSIRVPPPAEFAGTARLTITTVEGRPVYRAAPGQSVFADTGDPVPPVDVDQAIRIARAFAGGHLEVRYEDRLLDADQWSFGVRGRVPLHRLAVEDGAGTRLYVAESGGDVVLKTTAAGRRWGAAGAVLHWLYFTPFRRHAGLWADAVIWVSVAGTAMCVIGLAWGLWRFAPFRGYRLREHRQWSPYASSMRWHHYAGLLFGITTLTWVFSGLLSMDPWDWHPGTAPTREQRARVAGEDAGSDDRSADRIRKAIAAFSPAWPKEVELARFRGHSYASAAAGIVALDAPHLGAQTMLRPDVVIGAASIAMPGVAIDGLQWMDEYDAYYYDRDGRLSLPVLRVRYGDPQHTWLYFDPRRGTVVRKEERLSRVNRWLYHGLHSFDFPWLYYRRPLWDLLVIAFSAGGLVLSATTLTASWRRLRRHGRRLTSRPGES